MVETGADAYMYMYTSILAGLLHAKLRGVTILLALIMWLGMFVCVQFDCGRTGMMNEQKLGRTFSKQPV